MAKRAVATARTDSRTAQAPATTRAALYLRVSSEEQVEGFSLDGQREHLTGFARTSGYEVAGVYTDAGISGKDMEHRPDLLRLLADAKDGKFDIVLVWKTNRLSRRLKDLLVILETFEGTGVAYRSATEPQYETATPAGRLMMQMLGAIGEFERNTIIENVKMGMRQRSREGRWSGTAPLGYRLVDGDDGKGACLEVVPGDAALVKRIFSMYAEGRGLKSIANALNHAGHRTQTGKHFGIFAVKSILHNPAYLGLVREAGNGNGRHVPGEALDLDALIKGIHEPIITRRLWNLVHTIYQVRSGTVERTWGRQFPLTGLLRCPECGSAMTMSRSAFRGKDGAWKANNYYSCSRWKNKGSATCRSNGIRADEAERSVMERLRALVNDPGTIQALVEQVNIHRREHVIPKTARLEEIRREVKSLQAARDRYLREFERGKLAGSALEGRVDALVREIAVLEGEAEILRGSLTHENTDAVSVPDVRETLSRFVALLDAAEPDHQKTLLHVLIDRITVTNVPKGRSVDTIELHIGEKVHHVLASTESTGRKHRERQHPSLLNLCISI